jgi:hypothetical protein
LKREHLEDPDFDFSEAAIMIKDENGTPTIAPTDYRRIHDLEIYKKINFKLFQGVYLFIIIIGNLTRLVISFRSIFLPTTYMRA